MPGRPVRCAALALFVCMAAMGQVELRLDIENTTVLTHESVMAQVTVLNAGAVPLVINAPGGKGPQLNVTIEDDSGRAVARRRADALPKLVLQPGQAQVVEADLTMRFVLTRPDRYFVRVVLDGAVEARSSLKVVDVVPGMELVAATGSVPDAPGTRRTYSLRYWARKQKEHVFLCVSDAPSGRVFAPVYLGTLVRVVRPTVTPGEDGTVTVKHQVNRSEMMVSILKSRRDRLSLLSQRAVRMTGASLRKAPAALPGT